MQSAIARFYAGMLRRRGLALSVLVSATAVSSLYAARVRPDYSIEMAFPRLDHSRADYERFRQDFPYEDATALVVVEASDIFTRTGLQRIGSLERDLVRLAGVLDTQGLTTVRDVVADGVTIRTDRLVPGLDLTPDELARIRRRATSDPQFVWSLAAPDGRATTIQVTLTREVASTDATRTAFLHAARDVLRRHDDHARNSGVVQRLTLSGLPVIRAEFTELIGTDVARLFPIALLVILGLLYASFRSAADVAAALVTIVVSVLWLLGVMGVAGTPLQVLTQISPIVVMIVSISDTTHIVGMYRARRRQGEAGQPALAEACARNFVPCLLTELTIAGGFIGLAFNDMVMIQQFGLVTAAGAMLAWLANLTVLPLALSVASDRPAIRRGPILPWFIRRAERIILERPAAIVVVVGALLLTAAIVAPRIGREYYSYDDLRPSGRLYQSLRHVETVFGGSVPMAVFIEPAAGHPREPGAMLAPEALALIDRLTTHLRTTYPGEIQNVASLSDYLGKAHRLLTADDPDAGRLPSSRRLAVQELAAVEEPRVLRSLVSDDRATAAIFAVVPDRGSSRASAIIAALEDEFAREEAAHPYRLTLTGIYGLADGIYRSLVGGFVRSLGWAVLITLGMFVLVLRSARLALIALVPNLLPLVFTACAMGLTGIDLKPTTVVIFAITLVIADDDTIQYMTRFRERFIALRRASHPDPHRQAALDTLEESGPPMGVTAIAVAVGFSVLMLSQFLGLANLGLLTGVSLGAAFLADVFVTPLLLMTIRPRITP